MSVSPFRKTPGNAGSAAPDTSLPRLSRRGHIARPVVRPGEHGTLGCPPRLPGPRRAGHSGCRLEYAGDVSSSQGDGDPLRRGRRTTRDPRSSRGSASAEIGCPAPRPTNGATSNGVWRPSLRGQDPTEEVPGRADVDAAVRVQRQHIRGCGCRARPGPQRVSLGRGRSPLRAERRWRR